jgi:hypothetical protein
LSGSERAGFALSARGLENQSALQPASRPPETVADALEVALGVAALDQLGAGVDLRFTGSPRSFATAVSTPRLPIA